MGGAEPVAADGTLPTRLRAEISFACFANVCTKEPDAGNNLSG